MSDTTKPFNPDSAIGTIIDALHEQPYPVPSLETAPCLICGKEKSAHQGMQYFCPIIATYRAGPGVPSLETLRRTFIGHIGEVSVSNYGTVRIPANVFTPPGLVVREIDPPAQVVIHADAVKEIARFVRESIAEMKKEGVYAR